MFWAEKKDGAKGRRSRKSLKNLKNILMYDPKLSQLGMHSEELRAVILIDIGPILHSSYAGSNWKELKCPPPDDRETRCSRPIQ